MFHRIQVNARGNATEKTILTAAWSFRVGLSFLFAIVSVLPAAAQQNSTDLTNQSLEDLMNIQVTSVSKKEEKLFRAASAIFVITSEDIRRSGATNIPDLLRMVPGLDVAQIDGSTWAISARGFNGQFSNKLLVMIDRRVVYTSTFAGVFWDTMDLPLDDIDRIEVIRGPGGALWGVNAVNGVISIFTKMASDTKGGLATIGGGNVQQTLGMLRYGGSISPTADYRVYARYFNQSDMLNAQGGHGVDGWHTLRGGFRVDDAISPKDSLTLEGDISSGSEGEFGFVLPSVTSPGLVPVPEQISIADGSFGGVWNHTYSARSDTSLQFSFDRHLRHDPQNPEIRDTADLQFQHHLAAGERQDIIWGLGFRYTPDRITGGLTVTMNPTSRALHVFSSFFQDEIALVPGTLYLTLGTKFEHNDYSGFEFMPDARIAWLPSKRHTVWAAVSRDLRAPSRNDTDLVLNLGTGPAGPPYLLRILGNPNFKDERLIAYEVGYRTALSDRLSFDVTSYFNDYDSLETTEPENPFSEATPLPPHIVLPLTYKNLMYGETHGIEFAGNWQVSHHFLLSSGYAFEDIHMHTLPGSLDTQTPLFVEGASPCHSAQLRSRVDIRKGLSWNTSAYFVDRLNNQGPQSNVVIPAYTRVDTGLTWQIQERLSIAFVGQNLEKDHHLEFEDINGALQNGQVKRSAYLKIAWQF